MKGNFIYSEIEGCAVECCPPDVGQSTVRTEYKYTTLEEWLRVREETKEAKRHDDHASVQEGR